MERKQPEEQGCMPPARRASGSAKPLCALLAWGCLALAACSTDPDSPSEASGLEADLLGTWETKPSPSGSYARYVFERGGRMHLSSYFSDTLEHDGTYLIADSMLVITLFVRDFPVEEFCLRILEIGDSAIMRGGLLLEGGNGGLEGTWRSVSSLPDDSDIPRVTGLRFHADGTLILTAPTAVDTARYVVDGGIIRITEHTVNRPDIDYLYALRANRLALWELSGGLRLFRAD